MAENGASVVIVDIDSSLVDTTVKELRNDGLKVIGLKIDVSKSKQVKDLFEDVISKYNNIDILVNNAGIYIRKPFELIEEHEWDKLYSVNNKGFFVVRKLSFI